MGLDMYLRAERYVSGYEHRGEAEVAQFAELVKLAGLEGLATDDSPGMVVSLTCAYWRKANAIHRWFVQNVQGGEDKCRPCDVSREQLATLRDLCKKVLAASELMPGTVHAGTTYSDEHPQGAVEFEDGEIIRDPQVAHALLPTQEGFFFGGTDYDEWYYRGLESTAKQLDRVLSFEPADGVWLSFEYQSSW